MATIIRDEKTLILTAVDANPLDGTNTGRTFQAADRPKIYTVVLNEEVDAVTIKMDGTGADSDTAVFNIFGYSRDGPRERIYHTVTATLGTAVAGAGKCYAEKFAGTSTHVKTVGVMDSVDGGNSVAKIVFDTTGLKYLVFEPITFNTLTAITFHIREWGNKQ